MPKALPISTEIPLAIAQLSLKRELTSRIISENFCIMAAKAGDTALKAISNITPIELAITALNN